MIRREKNISFNTRYVLTELTYQVGGCYFEIHAMIQSPASHIIAILNITFNMINHAIEVTHAESEGVSNSIYYLL